MDRAVGGAGQVALLVITQVMVSPFARVLLEYVALFVPVFTPLTCH